MSRSLFSPSWYRVAPLKPRLRGHTQVHRQTFRDQVWYVVQDHVTGRFHRLSPAAHYVLTLMNGRRTVQEIWDLAAERFGDDLPTQDEVIQLLARLHRADGLACDVPPDVVELTERADDIRQKTMWQSVKNPMALRVPLFDPDRFLLATLPMVRPLFGWFGAILWIGIVLTGAVLAALHWPLLTENVVDRVLTVENIALLLLAYPLIKAFHELGHAYATRLWGGEVHDIGIMFLVFMPVPYVDATAASALPGKWQRALVGAAGILVEVFIAAVAMIAWVHLEPGLARAFAFNVMLIAGVSTILFNGNPLLKFDGYYVLADLVEIPNLAARANQYLLYLVQRYLFGVTEADSPVTAPGERLWFVLYGLLSLAYRLFIVAVIVLFVAGQFFFIGVLLAVWAVILMVIMPAGKGLWFLLTGPRLHGRRARAAGVVGAVTGALLAALFLVPLPYATLAEGVVWVPEQSRVRAGAEGFIDQVLARPETTVAAGDPLFALADPFLGMRVDVLAAAVAELKLRHAAAYVTDRVEAELIGERLDQATAEFERARQRARELVVGSPGAGVFLVPGERDLPGRFVEKGATLGYVVGDRDPIVRVVVPQAEIDLVRQSAQAVSVRFASAPGSVLPASLEREVPAATDRLPSLALSTVGGGAVPLAPGSLRDDAADTALESLFLLDFRLPADAPMAGIGERVHVRFDHGDAALAPRLYRRLRLLFLSHFDV